MPGFGALVTLEQQYLEAVIPTPVRLLGQWLLPYSVGHEFLLRRHENVFRSGQPADDLTLRIHLFMGVWICCQSWEENMAAVQQDQTHKAIRKWQQRCGEFDLMSKANEFASYIASGHRIFPFTEVKKKGKPRMKPGAPLPAILQAFLHRRMHFSINEAMNLPLSQAWQLYLTFAEQEDAVKIYSEDDKAQDDAVREAAAKAGMQLIKVRK